MLKIIIIAVNIESKMNCDIDCDQVSIYLFYLLYL